ncbi:hypothetical protein YC2023_072542 [Brassica napus]
MGCEELKPIANTRARDGDFEDREIAERLRRSREQPVIRRDRCIRKGDVENPGESYTHTSTFLYNMKMPKWIDIPITSIPVRVFEGSETDLTSDGKHWSTTQPPLPPSNYVNLTALEASPSALVYTSAILVFIIIISTEFSDPRAS